MALLTGFSHDAKAARVKGAMRLASIAFLFAFVVLFVSAACIRPALAVTQDELDGSLKEVMLAYYTGGQYTQYNSSKRAVYAPEEATSQDTQYTICSGFAYNVYYEAFQLKPPVFSANYVETARIHCDDSACVLYYAAAGDDDEALDGDGYDSLIADLRPGDVIAYNDGGAGHVLMVYDVFVNSSGEHDAILLNSTGGPHVVSKLSSMQRINLNMNERDDSAIPESFPKVVEGTIRATTFRSVTTLDFTKDGFNEKRSYAIMRLLDIGDDGSLLAFYNGKYLDEPQNVSYEESKGQLRLSLSGISISKTVDARDNNTVGIGSGLTYTLEITNNGSETYENLRIDERIEGNARFIGTQSEYATSSLQDTISFLVPVVEPGVSVTIELSAQVCDEDDDGVIETGTLGYEGESARLTTGTVENKVGQSLSSEEASAIRSAYEELKGSVSGLALVSQIYKKASMPISFEGFDLSKLICKSDGSFEISHDCIDQLSGFSYASMILNDYWNALEEESDGYKLPLWSEAKRADEINGGDFQDGDILIYENHSDMRADGEANTYEDGVYAFIYIDGAFVGANYDGTAAERSSFTAQYYEDNGLTLYEDDGASGEVLEYANLQTLFGKDAYVVLRPAQGYCESTGLSNEFAGAIPALYAVIGLGVAVLAVGAFAVMRRRRLRAE